MEARLNVNMIRGGLKVNIVPDECVIAIDRRLIQRRMSMMPRRN
jgi:acetylornithine deacetylase/succinyl-diaminopimelate desuccinylase-like protein